MRETAKLPNLGNLAIKKIPFQTQKLTQRGERGAKKGNFFNACRKVAPLYIYGAYF